MEHEDASQSILVGVAPVSGGASFGSVVNGSVSHSEGSVDLRDNELSSVTPADSLEGVSFSSNVSESSVSQAAVNNGSSSDSQAATNKVVNSSGSQAAANKVISSDSQAAAKELISSCGSQAAASKVHNSSDSQAAVYEVVSSDSQAAVNTVLNCSDSQVVNNFVGSGSQAAVTELTSSYGSQAADDSPSPSRVHSQVLLDSPDMDFEVCFGSRKRVHSDVDGSSSVDELAFR